MKTNIERAMQRTQRYWYDDGLTEIAVGLVLALVGLMFFVEAAAPRGALWPSFSAILLPVLAFGGAILGNRLVKAAKERLTYPRTGYVSYPKPKQGRLAASVIVALGMAVLVAVLFLTAPVSLRWIPLLQGVLVGALFLYFGHTVHLWRFYLIAAISIFAGAGASLTGGSDVWGNAVFFAIVGVSLIISGTLALLAYLRRTSPPED